MILVQDKNNVVANNSEYPFGQIRDRNGIVAGTPGSVETYGDFHQFFENLIRESDVIPNGLLDSEYNGYQLWEAFDEHVKNLRNYTRYYVRISQTGTSAPTVDNEVEADFGSPTVITYVNVGRYDFTFAGTPIDQTGKTFFNYTSNFDGYMTLAVTSNNSFRLTTFDSTASFSNGLLSGTEMYVEVYD